MGHLKEQERTVRTQARALWAPAHDPQWLAQADLLQAARVWSAAAPYADTEPEADSGIRKSEERLRNLHPYAMGHYDRLRSEGASPLDAMREAAPLFAREPHARPGQPSNRLRIGAGPPDHDQGSGIPADDGNPAESSPDQDPCLNAEARGRRIAERLQAGAQDERGSELSSDELVTALEEKTNLPIEIIGRIAQADNEERVAAGAECARSADLGHAADMAAVHSPDEYAADLRAARRDTMIADTASAHAATDKAAAHLAAESFPCTTADGIRAAVTGSLQQPAPSRTPAIAAQDAKRPASSIT